MPKRNWKRTQPTGLNHAMELCLEYARERHNRSVDRVAEGMGMANKWTLYKWMESGSLPARMIRPFEDQCGIDFVSRYLATSAGKLVIDVPTGKKAKVCDIAELQELLNAATGQLIKFWRGNGDAGETLAAIQSGMEALALHRGQVEKSQQPEFDFGGNDEH